MSATLTLEAPFGTRLAAYLRERFPLIGHGILIVSYFSSNQFLAEVLTAPDRPVAYGLYSVLGAVALFCFFFHLRVFDEHKDYADDCRHHPHRVLQRGLVTLGDLRRLGIVAIVVGAVAALLAGWAAFVAWLIAFLFSLLMLREFFVGPWLKKRFLLYAISHMLLLPLLALMIFSFTTGQPPWQAPGWFWLYAFVGFFVSFNWEVSRKIRAPEQEIDGLDSYTKRFGVHGAAWVVLGIRVVDTALVMLVGWHLQLSPFFYLALILLFLVCLVGFVQYRLDTNPRTAKRMETYAGLYIIAFDLILAVELIRRQGLEIAGLEVF
ncbi:MAG: UbiA family prenyltransferase [Acidobacteriota bacterium]